MECKPEEHKEHMCSLKATKQFEVIECLSKNPTVVCGNCQAMADRAENLCRPQKL